MLILGRAGIGKTTLCHKLLIEAQTLWSKHFRWVWWLPLRELTHFPAQQPLTLVTWIAHHYQNVFATLGWDQATITHCCTQLAAQAKETLWIIDGWDEIASFAETPPLKSFLESLFAQPNFILTSRPQGLPSIEFDRKLETLGFTDDNIKQYIERFFNAFKPPLPQKGQQLLTLARANPNLWAILHIPINAELIASIWDLEEEGLEPSLSLTELYDKLILALLRRFLKNRSQQVTHYWTNQRVLSHPSCQVSLHCLGRLAFEGLSNKEIILKGSLLQKVLAEIKQAEPADTTWLDELLKIGLLKPIKEGPFEASKDYIFLHLTFQEYFAACFWATQFTSEDREERKQAEDFLRNNKYDPYLQVFWMFAVGKLKGNVSALDRFFDGLIAEPRDLVGVAELGLIIQSLEACAVDEKLRHRAKLLTYLREWLDVEEIVKRKDTAAEYLFAEHYNTLWRHLRLAPNVIKQLKLFTYLESMLHHDNKEIERIALAMLQNLEFEGEEAAQLLLNLINVLSGSDGNASYSVSTTLGELNLKGSAATQALLLLKPALNAKNRDVRHSANYALSKLNLEGKVAAQEILQLLEKAFSDGDSYDKCSMIGTLGELKLEESAVMQALPHLINALGDKDSGDVRNRAIFALHSLKLEGSVAMQAVLLLEPALNSQDDNVKCDAISALRNLNLEGKAAIQRMSHLISAFSGNNDCVRNRVISALSSLKLKDAKTAQEVLQLLEKAFSDESIDVKRNAIDALGELKLEEDAVLQALPHLIKLLGDNDGNIRSSAIGVLDKLNLEDVTTGQASSDLINMLTNNDNNIRSDVIFALGKLKLAGAAATQVMPHLIKALSDSEIIIRRRATFALGSLKLEEKAVMQTVGLLLELVLSSNDNEVRYDAISALCSFNLEGKVATQVLSHLINVFNDTVAYIRHHVIYTLSKLQLTGEAAIQRTSHLINMLSSEDVEIRRSVISALSELELERDATETVLFFLINVLNDKKVYGCNAIRVLGKLKLERDAAMQRISHLINMLSNEDVEIRRSVINGLSKLKLKGDTATQALLLLINAISDNNDDIRNSAIKALYNFNFEGIATTVVMPHLIKLLRSNDSVVKIAAIDALGKLKHEGDTAIQSVPHLINALSDNDIYVKYSAVNVLNNFKLSQMWPVVSEHYTQKILSNVVLLAHLQGLSLWISIQGARAQQQHFIHFYERRTHFHFELSDSLASAFKKAFITQTKQCVCPFFDLREKAINLKNPARTHGTHFNRRGQTQPTEQIIEQAEQTNELRKRRHNSVRKNSCFRCSLM